MNLPHDEFTKTPTYPLLWHELELKYKRPRPGFEPVSSIPFPTMVTVTLSMPHRYNEQHKSKTMQSLVNNKYLIYLAPLPREGCDSRSNF